MCYCIYLWTLDWVIYYSGYGNNDKSLGVPVDFRFSVRFQRDWLYVSLVAPRVSFSHILTSPTLVETTHLTVDTRSPWWLVSKNRDETALKSLQTLGLSAMDATKKLANIKMTMEANRQETDGVTYLECFRKSNLRRTIISIAPLSIHAFAGISFLGTYFSYYIQLSGISAETSFQIGVGNGVSCVVANIISLFFIDRVGRRNLSLVGMMLIVLLLGAFSACAVVGTVTAAKGSYRNPIPQSVTDILECSKYRLRDGLGLCFQRDNWCDGIHYPYRNCNRSIAS